MEIREKVIYQGPEEQTEPPTKDERTQIIISHQERTSVHNLSSNETRNYGKKFTRK